MKVIFVPEAERVIPASRYRVYFLISELERQGVNCVLVNPPPADFISFLRSPWYTLNLVWQVLKHHGADILFIHRGLSYRGQCLAVLFAKILGLRIVFDFDDAVFLQATKAFYWMMRLANAGIASNDYLAAEARRYTRGRIYIISTLIPNRLLNNVVRASGADKDKTVLVWIGMPGNFQYFEVIRSALEKLAARYRLLIKIISRFDTDKKIEDFLPAQLPLQKIRWSQETEWQELAGGDIGLMPLPEGSWERGKGGFKMIQYMALGIVPVGSAVGENLNVVQDGVSGFLFKDADECYEKIEKLINDVALRETMGHAALNCFKERYMLETHIPQYLSLLRDLVIKN